MINRNDADICKLERFWAGGKEPEILQILNAKTGHAFAQEAQVKFAILSIETVERP